MPRRVLPFLFFLAACATGAGLEPPPEDDVDAAPPPPDVDAAPDAPPAPIDATPAEVCDNQLDDDVDGFTDCQDGDCAAAPHCQPETACADGQDNEGDQLADCADPDCDGVGTCEMPERSCKDSLDNDADGMKDCADPDCADAAHCVPETACADGLDNDEDGMKDCLDFDCDGHGTCEFGTETRCADGVDNDADGQIDCLDAHCDGVGMCEHGSEASCGDGADNDADGKTDCADSDCAAGATCIAGCPAGSSATAYVATGLPKSVPDLGTTEATIATSGQFVVTKTLVRLSITHSYAGDLDISLIPPGMGAIDLSSDNGGTGDNFTSTLFTDGAATAITAGSPPYTGSFRPEQALGQTAGRPLAGTWTLRVVDDESVGAGSLTDWTLYVCSCFGTAGCEFGAACQDGLDDDADGKIDCADSDCAAVTQCIPENCTDGVDNNGNGLADCADPACASLPTCEGDCHDGVDGNGNGQLDCLDPTCAGDPSCEPAGEVSCNDGVDNDSDGVVDCAEALCGFACTLPACAAGERLVAGKAGDLPKNVADNSTVSSTITFTRAGSVRRVAVRFSATHPYDADLDVSLVSPAGTSRDLSSDNGGDGDNYAGTVFLDSSTTSIVSGTAPFSSTYKPEQTLSLLNGESVTGGWKLNVSDDAGTDTGSFTGYELAICVSP